MAAPVNYDDDRFSDDEGTEHEPIKFPGFDGFTGFSYHDYDEHKNEPLKENLIGQKLYSDLTINSTKKDNYNLFKHKLYDYFNKKNNLTFEDLSSEYRNLELYKKADLLDDLLCGEIGLLLIHTKNKIGSLNYRYKWATIDINKDLNIKMSNSHIKNIIEFLCEIYGSELLIKKIESETFFRDIWVVYIPFDLDNQHDNEDQQLEKNENEITYYTDIFVEIIKPFIQKTISDWETRMKFRVDKVLENGRTPKGYPLPRTGIPSNLVNQYLTGELFGAKFSRKSPKKLRKSPRKPPKKLRKSRKSPKKSPKKLRKSARKSRKPARKSKKLRKSPRKSARKLRKSRN